VSWQEKKVCATGVITRYRGSPGIVQQGSYHQESSTQVDRDDLLPLVKRHLFEGNDGVVPGAVNQDVYSASLGTNRVRKATRVILFGNISFDSNEPVLDVPYSQQRLKGVQTVVDREDRVSVGKETANNL
jgi:hypothetical protein